MLKRLDHFFAKIESFLLIFIFLLVLVISTLQIVLRLLHSGIVWLDPFLRTLMLWTALLGGALAVQKNASIKIDLLERLIPPSLQVFIKKCLFLVCFAMAIFLLWISIKFIQTEKTFGENAFLFIKTWHIELAFPIGFFLISFHFFTKLLSRNS